jgi:DNA-binding GntR family transcriptional regulator
MSSKFGAGLRSGRRAWRRKGSQNRRSGLSERSLKGHKAAERGSGSRSLFSLNAAFHEGLATASGNAVLIEVLNSIIKQFHRPFAAVAEQRRPESWSEHEAILDAIARGKGDEAGRLMVEHSQRTQEVFVRYWSTNHRSPATRSKG